MTHQILNLFLTFENDLKVSRGTNGPVRKYGGLDSPPVAKEVVEGVKSRPFWVI